MIGLLALAFGASLLRAAEKDLRFSGEAAAPAEPLSLWYRRPAGGWLDALALGNGRLGAMVFGRVQEERIGLNEDTLWSGGPYSPAADVAPETLREIRELLFAGKHREAQNLSNKLQAQPNSQASYQTVGELLLTFPGATGEVRDYRRQLDLDTAIATVTYEQGGVRYKREVFSSPVDQVIVVRLTADQPGKLHFETSFVTPQPAQAAVLGSDTVALTGGNSDMENRGKVLVKAGLTFQARARVMAEGGTTTAAGDRVTVKGATSVTLLLAAASSYKSYKDVSGDPVALCQAYLAGAQKKRYDTLKAAHVAEHQRLFRRVSLDLGAGKTAQLPTNERLKAFRAEPDPSLAALYFQFGRYLLMASSRPGSQPANLQGIWNDKLTAAWGGKYTVNINTQMNYWPAQVTNLPETEEPLFRMVAEVAETGRETARRTYGAGGWVLHHNTDLWRPSAPIDGAYWGQWPMGGAWFCNHLYQRYLFDGDKAYLAKLYPLMKGSAQFFLETLVEEPKRKWLVTAPSNSPENEYLKGLTVTAGPTMDMDILRELFTSCIQAAETLGQDPDLRKKWAQTRDRLAPHQVGAAGQLQEWLDDFGLETPDVQHRHMSPFYGLYPGNTITPADPRIFAATRKLAETRGYLRPLGMGWAVAWRINLWARLRDGEQAGAFVDNIIAHKTENNFFDKPSVQLDGNYGATAGIAEMLVQSHAGEVHLLPALPKGWGSGSFKGLRARGGFVVEVEWRDGKLVSATLRNPLTRPIARPVRYGEVVVDVNLKPGSAVKLGPGLRREG